MTQRFEEPGAGLAGVSDAGAAALQQAFNVKTVGDLGRNKFFRAAHTTHCIIRGVCWDRQRVGLPVPVVAVVRPAPGMWNVPGSNCSRLSAPRRINAVLH